MAAENPKRYIILVGTPVLSRGILNEYRKNEIGLLNEKKKHYCAGYKKNQNIFGTFFSYSQYKKQNGYNSDVGNSFYIRSFKKVISRGRISEEIRSKNSSYMHRRN